MEWVDRRMPDWSSNTWQFFNASFHEKINVGVLFTPSTPALKKYTGFHTLSQVEFLYFVETKLPVDFWFVEMFTHAPALQFLFSILFLISMSLEHQHCIKAYICGAILFELYSSNT